MKDLNVILFGATGHLGQGVLIECLMSENVKSMLSIGRRLSGKSHAKLTEIQHADFLLYDTIADRLSGYNACFFCLGVSSAGMSEEKYHLITHDFAEAVGKILNVKNPDMTFCFISGAGADDTLKSRMRWARVKGKAENTLKAMPFTAVYIFRPAYIHLVKGVKPTLKMYSILGALYPVWKSLLPKYVTTTEEVGKAMIHAATQGCDVQTLENKDIIRIGRL